MCASFTLCQIHPSPCCTVAIADNFSQEHPGSCKRLKEQTHETLAYDKEMTLLRNVY
jgi:hypothetical protein